MNSFSKTLVCEGRSLRSLSMGMWGQGGFCVLIFEDERDMSLLKAERKGSDERKLFKDARSREGLLDGGCRALGADFGAPTAKKAPTSPQ